MSFEENIKKGTFFGFIPKRLEIEGRPELGAFPFNVLFASWTVKDGSRIMGSAIYEPDLASYKREDGKCEMRYQNAYGGDCRLLIAYNEVKKDYFGEKFVNGKSAGMAMGVEWKMFFVHFTALGLTAGERCSFETVA